MKITDNISIYAQVPLTQELKDLRHSRYGMKFGSIEKICRQYGIEVELLERCYKFSAPKSRLQMFVEKLHFAKLKFSREPF